MYFVSLFIVIKVVSSKKADFLFEFYIYISSVFAFIVFDIFLWQLVKKGWVYTRVVFPDNKRHVPVLFQELWS